MKILFDHDVPQFQQNPGTRRIAVVVLRHPKWPEMKSAVPVILEALRNAKPGTFVAVEPD